MPTGRPRQFCRCPPKVQKICRRARKTKADVDDIVAALSLEHELKKARDKRRGSPGYSDFSGASPSGRVRGRKPARWKPKRFPHPHEFGPCLPMSPSMHVRLQYIRHCDAEYPCPRDVDNTEARRLLSELDFSDGTTSRRRRRSVRYSDEVPCQIYMKAPRTSIKHTDSDKSILNVPSPKTSGENIIARRAQVRPQEIRPPLPATSGHDLFKPHSGIVLNQERDFVPEIGPGILINKPPPPPRKRLRACHKGGVCRNKKCQSKKCRKYRLMRKRQLAALRARRGPHLTQKECWTRSYARSMGARDGKPRSRFRKRFMPDDEDVCGIDEIQRPEHPVRPNLKKGSFKTHSLTILKATKGRRPKVRYGILNGSVNMYSDKFNARSRGRQALTMSIMAYCLAFHYHPKQWTTKLIDNLMEAGDAWYQQLLDNLHDHTPIAGMCEVLGYGRKKNLLLNGKKMQVLLSDPEIIGYTMSLDPKVYNLYRGLIAFFHEHRAGVLLTRILKLVIWKDKVCFYVFDPAGRNAHAFSDYASGSAALMNVADLKTVAELLLGRSILQDQRYVLAPIKVLKMIDEKDEAADVESVEELTNREKAMMSYRILTENSAVVNANIHLGDSAFGEARYRQSLPIAIGALTYSKISPTNTWYTRTIDKIIRLGNKLYKDWKNPKVMVDLHIDNVPNEIIMEPFACDIIIYRDRVKGQLFTTKKCLLNLRSGLADFFNRQYNSGLLEFNNITLAIWKQKEMFYIFDPFPRSSDGQRCVKNGKACCLMLLDTKSMAEALTKNWDYLPATTQFYIHAFKVLKVNKIRDKGKLKCTLSDEEVDKKVKKKFSRKLLKRGTVIGLGEGRSTVTIMPIQVLSGPQSKVNIPLDEEKMGDIISLIDSIQDEYVPPLIKKKRGAAATGGGEADGKSEKGGKGGGGGAADGGGDGGSSDEEGGGGYKGKRKIVNLDSPTVSATQIVPPWPKPRDKTNEPPDRDPDPEPTPPPTPPPVVPPEGAEEAAEEEEELDDEALALKREEEARRKREEEEARNKVDLPPPLPPPPPSPQEEIPLAPGTPPGTEDELEAAEMEALQPAHVERYVLLTEDAKRRFKLRQIRKKMTTPLTEALPPLEGAKLTEEELEEEQNNFMPLLDNTQIIRGKSAIPEGDSINVLPFTAIMAVVTSYKYAINTWTEGIVEFVVQSSKKLYEKKKEKFQLAPLHIIPKIGIGSQAYHANIDVVGEGATWQLEDVLRKKFFNKYDRGMITTPNYSCAIFKRYNHYYLFDGSPCNVMGLRDIKGIDKNGKACFLRFKSLHDLVSRINHNKNGKYEDQQFILSKVLVRRLLPEARMKLPEDYDYVLGEPKGKKSRRTIVDKKGDLEVKIEKPIEKDTGYKNVNGVFRIEGTTALNDPKKGSDVKACHFVSLVAMLMATMHPLSQWNQIMVDTCIEKGLEIYEKAGNKCACEKRAIKNIILDGKFMNVNIKKIIVINENPTKTMEQYMRAVLNRLRYVIVKYPEKSIVICQADGFYHVFDPYSPPKNEPNTMDVGVTTDSDTDAGKSKEELKKEMKEKKKKEKEEKKKMKKEKSTTSVTTDDEKKKKAASKKSKEAPKGMKQAKPGEVAGWTLYRNQEAVLDRIRRTVKDGIDDPEFYTFELTSVKNAPRRSALLYKLSPMFKPEMNPNQPYLVEKKPRPLVQEKMYWLNIEYIPWSRMNEKNDAGFVRKTARTLWKEWDIEIPGDLYSLWGTVHPTDKRFPEQHRGKQYLACCFIALVVAKTTDLAAWTSNMVTGIVTEGDNYHKKLADKIGNKPNHEVTVEDFNGINGTVYPYSFDPKSEKVIFGFFYNINPDCFNLSQALSFFFQKYSLGIMTCPQKNLAFGKIGSSYFMFDCQSDGPPVFCPGKSSGYVLRCQSLNRLIYVMTITVNISAHNQQFHLYSVDIKLKELDRPRKAVPPPEGKAPKKGSSTESVKSGKSDKSDKSDKKKKK